MTDAEKATLPQGHLDRGPLQVGPVYFGFWLDKGDEMLQRFTKFAAQ